MNLSFGVLLTSLVLGALFGPLELLVNIPDGAITSSDYWADVGTEAIRSFAGQAQGVVTVVASGVGITLYRTARSKALPPSPGDGV